MGKREEVIILVDGDILVYRFAFSNETTFEWGNGVTSSAVQADKAYSQIDGYIEKMVDECLATGVIVCLSSPNNFRKELFPDYKANRTNPRPALYNELRDYLKTEYNTREWDGLEADDVMGILQTGGIRKPTIICSIDKDMRTIPGAIYDPMKKEYFEVTLEEADFNFYKQTLIGDPTDNFKGCKGVGEKKAEKLLRGKKEDETYWDVVLREFLKRGHTEEEAITQARMARILRLEDFDIAKWRVKLWEP